MKTFIESGLTGSLRWLFAAGVLLLSSTSMASISQYSSDQFHFSVSDAPDWVKPVALPEQADSQASRGKAIHYLLSEWQTKVGNHQDTTEYSRIVYSPESISGLKEAAKIVIDFSPAYEELVIHNITVHRGDQVFQRLVPDKVRLIQQEKNIDQDLYEGEVSALIILDDIRVGDVIDYSYSIRGRNPVFGDKYFSYYSLGWRVPVDRVAVRLLAPLDRPMQTRSYNTDLKATVSVADGMREYRWMLDNARALKDEDGEPSWFSASPWLQISEYKNWKEVTAWADDLYQSDTKLSPELMQQIKAWRDESHDKRDAVRHALEFVQDQIRYFGVEMGQNSHRPSNPSEVFARRFGDCKDKAVLLVAMLKEMGIKAYPALVSMSRTRAIGQWLPSPGDFDHVIAMARIGHKTYWLDGTISYQKGKLDMRGMSNYGKALVIGRHDRKLVDMTLPDDYVPEVYIQELFVADDYKQPVKFTVTSTYSYDEADWKRYFLANNALSDISDSYINYYARIYPGIVSDGDIEVLDDSEHDVVRIIEHYKIPDYWEKENGRLYSNLYGLSIKDYIDLPKVMNRKTPLAQTYPLHVVQTSILQYPEDIDFDDINEDVVFEDDAMKFAKHSSYENQRLEVRFEYDAKKDAVMPDEMAKHLALRRQIKDNLSFSAWIQDRETYAAMPAKKLTDLVFKKLMTTAAQ